MIDTEKNPGLPETGGMEKASGAGWRASKLVVAGGIVALAGALLLYFYFLYSSGCATCGPVAAPVATTTDSTEAGVREVRGVVVANDKSQVPVDGPALLIVREESGTETNVYYTRGMMPCASNASDVGWNVSAGDTIAAVGQISDEGGIMLCGQEGHSLTVIASGAIQSGGKLRQCPDEWIVDRMPGPEPEPGAPAREYFILNGARRELSEFDLGWVKANCEAKPAEVF